MLGMAYLELGVNTMPVDAPAPKFASASAGRVLAVYEG